MSIRQLAKQNIETYCQDNPFDADTNKASWTEYNLIYQEELLKYFSSKTQEEYFAYYDRVHELEQQEGQLSFF